MGTAWWQQISTERWARAATAFMALAVAWSLAQLTWLVLPGGVSELGRAAPAPQVRQARSTPRLAPVADLSLFGRIETVAGVGGGPVDAPETRLNLILRGVLATGSPPYARAIVSAAGGDERSYRVGEDLPGGATLDQVLADRVILQRAGRFEALYLPKDMETPGASFARAGSPSVAGRGSGVAAHDTGMRLQQVREQIMQDPTQAFSLARVQPVMEGGKLRGYRLSPNREQQLFRQLGLQPGDVVTSVNGIPLDDPATVGEVLGQLTTSSELVLTLDRHGRQETVVVPFQ
ncbi:MAG: type II secretion system protein GspC [Thiohalomonadaceae bacterium]